MSGEGKVHAVRKVMPPSRLTREAFERRFRQRFHGPAYAAVQAEIDRLAAIAWDEYDNSRKSPVTHPAGPGFADPAYELSDEWREASRAIREAEQVHRDPAGPDRYLLINGSMRSENTCPGESSKTWRLLERARQTLEAEGDVAVEVLDLSRLASEYGRTIHPCKSCVSTAMPLCHWPCSCYPNHSLGQVDDWMNEIYPMWVRAHGIMILCPVNWYQAPSGLKLMIDRLVCADGGNPDPTSTGGKDAARAKAIEAEGWSYPRHLAGRAFATVVHGDSTGADGVRHHLADWLSDMSLVPAAGLGQLSRYIGYMENYADSHAALDRDAAVQDEVATAASALRLTVQAQRRGAVVAPGRTLPEPRPK